MLFVHTATEDQLSESVAIKILSNLGPEVAVGLKLRRGGFGYLKTSLPKFCQMAQREHVLLLVDLDRLNCAPALVNAWFGPDSVPPRLLFRVVVREIESWLMADREAFSDLFQVAKANIPLKPDEVSDPKEFLLQLAKRAPRNIRTEIMKARDAVARQGLGYNKLLTAFVEQSWSPNRARLNSPSLDKAMHRLNSLIRP